MAQQQQQQEYKRKLAWLSKIDAIDNTVEPSHSIVVAKIGLWQCVVPLAYRVGDLVVYISIDAMVDIKNPVFAFLDNPRIRTKRLRGSLSQGLALHVAKFAEAGIDLSQFQIDDDLTDFLGITKYVSKDDEVNGGVSTTRISKFIQPTDEPRMQDWTAKIPDLIGRDVVITTKMDGCSATYIWLADEFYVCSRNLILTRGDPNAAHYFAIADKLQLEACLKAYGRPLAIRGEIVGPKINGGRVGVKSSTFYVFNIYAFDMDRYLLFDEYDAICAQLTLQMAPTLYCGPFVKLREKYPLCDTALTLDMTTTTSVTVAEGVRQLQWTEEVAQTRTKFTRTLFENFMTIAEGNVYEEGRPAEGIVVKTNDLLGQRISFKVISNKYLLKYGL